MIDEWQYEETETFDTRLNRLFWELKQALTFDRGSILLAVYRSEFVREEVEAELTRRLRELGQRAERVYINEQNHDLPMYLRYRADQKTTVYFVSGVRFGGGRDGQNAFRALNFRREYFVEYRLRMVLWLTEGEERLLPLYAPDFWAFRHRVVTFLDDPRPEQIGKHAKNLAWREFDTQWGRKDKEDTDAKIAYRERLLAELPETAEATATRLDLLYTLAPLYAAKGEGQQAIKALEQTLDLAGQLGDTSRQAWAYNSLGLVNRDLGQHQAALADFGRAIDLNPDDATTYNNRGLTYSDLGQHEAALADFGRAIDLNPDYATAYNNRGNTYRDLGQHQAALTDYGRAIDLNPDYAAAYYNRGNTYRALGQHEAALADYGRAIDLNPDDAAAYNNRGTTYRDLGQHQAALADFGRAIDLNPDDAAAYNNRGLTYSDLGQHEAALADYGRAIDLNPDDATAYNNRGTTYRDLGQHEAALADYGRAIDLNPDYATAYNNRGNTYSALGRYPEALSSYKKSHELQPRAVSAFSIAACYRKLGQEAAYEAQVKIARELIGQESEYNRACFEAICGNVPEAIALLEQAIAKTPHNRVLARTDPDFDFIRDDPRFQALVGTAVS